MPGDGAFACLGDEGEKAVGFVGTKLLKDVPQDFSEDGFGFEGFGGGEADFLFYEAFWEKFVPAVDDEAGVGWGGDLGGSWCLGCFFALCFGGEFGGGGAKLPGVAFLDLGAFSFTFVGFATVEFLEGVFPLEFVGGGAIGHGWLLGKWRGENWELRGENLE